MKKNNKNIAVGKKGFTLIEILIVIIIITILVTVILVSLVSAQHRAQDNAVFTSFKSADSQAFMCLSSQIPTVILKAPVLTGGNSICSDPLITDAVWPDFSKNGWSNDTTDPNNGFYWCDVNATGDTVPATGAYNGTTIGGNIITTNFCFMLKKDNKYMWCTATGCQKQGF